MNSFLSKKTKVTKYYAIFFAIVFLLCFRQADAVTISPAKLELVGNPGQTISANFLLINEQDSDKTFYSSSENFEAEGDSGTPHFMGPGGGDLSSWIVSPSSIALKKGEQKTFYFDIKIPANAEPGGHFAAVFLSTSPTATSSSEVSVGAKIGVLVLLRVTGDVKEGGGVTSFSSENGSHFFSSLPINFIYHFQNSGGDRVKPTGEFRVKNILGWTKYVADANLAQGNILPNSTRKFSVAWGNLDDGSVDNFFNAAWYELTHFAFGIYKANLSLAYGLKGSTAQSSFLVFVIPWQLIVIFVIVFGGAYLIFNFILKRYNKWIISQARIQMSKSDIE